MQDLLDGYPRHEHRRRHSTPLARRSDDALDVALAVTVQRLRPVLLGCADVHAGGLDGGGDGGSSLRRRYQSRVEPSSSLWLHEQ